MTTATAPRRSAPPQPVPLRGGGGWLLGAAAAALLAGYLLFCHGCHGDEDNELSVFVPKVRRQAEN